MVRDLQCRKVIICQENLGTMVTDLKGRKVTIWQPCPGYIVGGRVVDIALITNILVFGLLIKGFPSRLDQ